MSEPGPAKSAPAAPADVAALRDTATIRQRARALLERARAGGSTHFVIHDAALDGAAALVAEVTRERYADLRIPFHSRWRHFEAGGTDRKAWLDASLAVPSVAAPDATPNAPLNAAPDAAALARARFDLVLVSVLLDAGAGASWRYHEARTGQVLSRSEGLGVASLHAFCAGLFSSDAAQPLRCDAAALQALDARRLAQAFQVDAANPLVGLDGRVDLLRRLGAAMAAQPAVFGPLGRPGGLFDHLLAGARAGHASGAAQVSAQAVLRALLDTLSDIWPSGQHLGGVALGDCWPCPALGDPATAQGWMPFHKLSQWLTYSLLEPLQWAGVQVGDIDALTGLPEYRNGGLLLDAGVLTLREPAMATRLHRPGDDFIIEWRALTVALLDELAPRVRARLGPHAGPMPLACILEGGTWAAGRLLAQRLREGSPPLRIDSDGTVF